jgi:hypothetical protein
LISIYPEFFCLTTPWFVPVLHPILFWWMSSVGTSTAPSSVHFSVYCTVFLLHFKYYCHLFKVLPS